jgi:undecaprenyl-diphosphatase
MAIAVVLTAATYAAAAATYCLLAFKPLRYGRTATVQLAAMFINRLLPGGLGALGVNYAYLHRMKHSPAQAGSVIAVNNLLGLLGHILLVAGTLVWVGSMALPHHTKSLSHAIELIAVGALLITCLALVFRRGRFQVVLREVRNNILSYRQRPWRVLAALASSMALTMANVLCLSSCALALGVHLSFAAILIVFTFGIGTSTAIPTPGGLGGFEAGLVAGVVAYHIANPTALAMALLYRLVSYWLPLAAGAVALVYGQKRQWFAL